MDKYIVLNSTLIYHPGGLSIEIKEALGGVHDVQLSDNKSGGCRMRVGIPLKDGTTYFIFLDEVVSACREMLLKQEGQDAK